MRVREETSWPSFLYRNPWRWVGVEALIGRDHTNLTRGLEGGFFMIDYRLGCR